MSVILIGLMFVALIVEILGWFTLHPLYMRIAVFRLKQQVPMPPVEDREALKRLTGSSENLSWRWSEEVGGLVFRRELRLLGRRAYFFGRVIWDEQGEAAVYWAPFPLLVYPIAALVFPVMGMADEAGFKAVLITPVVLAVAAANVVFTWMAVSKLVHELETGVLTQLGAARAL